MSSCRPSCVECLMSWCWECGAVSVSRVRLVKSVTCLWPRSAHSMGHLPPFDFCRCWRRSLNVLLCRLILSLAVNLHPPNIWVFVSGACHLVQTRTGLCFLLHLWIWTPHATSRESLLARYGAVEYACIVWSAPLVLASCKILPYMVL